MANAYTFQNLKDTTERCVIKLTGTFDGTGQEMNAHRLAANSLAFALDVNNNPVVWTANGGTSNTTQAYYDLQIIRLNYNVNFGSGGYVKLFWSGNNVANASNTGSGSNDNVIMACSFYGEYGEAQAHPPFPNASISGYGDMGVATFGASSNGSYTLIIEYRKNNAMYSRGQFQDPAAFSFGQYKLTP